MVLGYSPSSTKNPKKPHTTTTPLLLPPHRHSRSSLALRTHRELSGGHHGCVNRLHAPGPSSPLSLLSTGDDLSVTLWRFSPHLSSFTPCASLPTGHRLNVFGVRQSGDHVVTGAMDGEVRLLSLVREGQHEQHHPQHHPQHHQQHHQQPLAVCSAHTGRVKNVASQDDTSPVLYSVAEDATVRLFDVRTTGFDAGVVVRLPGPGKAIDVRDGRLAVGYCDGAAVFDVRRTDGPVSVLPLAEASLLRTFYPTHVSFAPDSSDLVLVNWIFLPPELFSLSGDYAPRWRPPDEAEALREKESANALYRAGDYSAAVDGYTRALMLKPGDSVLHANRAAALAGRATPGDTCEALMEAEKAGPDNPKAVLRAISATATLHRPATARAMAEAAAARFPEFRAEFTRVARGLGDQQDRHPRREGHDDYPAVPRAKSVRRYAGRHNTNTDIKEAVMTDLGVFAGCDTGQLKCWRRDTAELIWSREGDAHITNCIAPTPPNKPGPRAIFVSGIDDTIKVFMD